MARSTRALSTAGAAKANELANAKHEKNEVFMLEEKDDLEWYGEESKTVWIMEFECGWDALMSG